jgi:hypothetical protein
LGVEVGNLKDTVISCTKKCNEFINSPIMGKDIKSIVGIGEVYARNFASNNITLDSSNNYYTNSDFVEESFYLSKVLTGFIWLFTGGVFGLGYLYDLWNLNSMISDSNKAK